MKSVFLRVAAILVLVSGFALTGTGSASANVWNSYPWPSPGGDSLPVDCLDAGTVIHEGVSPNIHEVSASNACQEYSEYVQVDLQLFTSSGTLVTSCQTGSTNYAACDVSHGTPSGDYWNWNVFMGDTGQYSFGCDNKNSTYEACF